MGLSESPRTIDGQVAGAVFWEVQGIGLAMVALKYSMKHSILAARSLGDLRSPWRMTLRAKMENHILI